MAQWGSRIQLWVLLSSALLPLAGAQGQTQPEVIYEDHHDVSLTLAEMNPSAVQSTPQAPISHWPTQPTTHVATTPGLNFDGVGATSNWPTPDTSAAVGATQYMQAVNARFAVYDKTTGALLYGPVKLNTPWKGFGGNCEFRNDGDPTVQYDKAADRWIISRHAVPTGGPYLQCVAISTTSDATGNYYRYAFQLTTDWPDYPKLGVWPDAYYISINRANPAKFTNLGGLICALDRNSMLTGAAATAQCFVTGPSFPVLLPSDLDGSTPPPLGSPNYLMNLDTNSLDLWKFHVDFLTPANTTLTGPISIPVALFKQACSRYGGTCVPQLGTRETVDSVSDRLMHRLAYRNFGDHESLVLTHTIGSLAHIRWYEIRNPGDALPVIHQQGTLSPDSNFRWLGSIGMDKVGDIAVGYSFSGFTTHPGIRYTGRVPTDTLGKMEPEAIIMPGVGSQLPRNSLWNDVSSMSIDPKDDCTFWYSNEYYNAGSTGSWSTRIASFKFSSCH